MGNHDYYPTSDLPGEPNDIYVQTAALWDDWLREPQAKETFIRGNIKCSTILLFCHGFFLKGILL